jgi:hypothetical protein
MAFGAFMGFCAWLTEAIREPVEWSTNMDARLLWYQPAGAMWERSSYNSATHDRGLDAECHGANGVLICCCVLSITAI